MRATKLYKMHLLPSTIELMSGTLLPNPWVAPELDW